MSENNNEPIVDLFDGRELSLWELDTYEPGRVTLNMAPGNPSNGGDD